MTYESNQLAKYNGYLATITDRESNYELMHYGIKGQKHGIRRFQNEDGTLTEEGKRRYGVTDTGTGGDRKRSTAEKYYDKKYASAVRKLQKLDDKTNVNLQKMNTSMYSAQAKKAAAAGASMIGLGTGGGLGALALAKKNRDDARQIMNNAENYSNKYWKQEYKKAEKLRGDAFKLEDAGDIINKTGRVLGAASLGVAAVKTGQALASKYRTTEKGHAKAVAKRKQYYQKMQKEFAGTPYSDLLKKYAKQA